MKKDYLFKKEDAEIVSQRLIKIVKELNTVFRSNPADQRIDGLFVDDRHFAIQKFKQLLIIIRSVSNIPMRM